MSSSWLELNGRKFTQGELMDSSTVTTSNSDFENSTLSFCHDWLTGKNEFALITSGSTGSPKSINLKRRQMEASARLTIQVLQLKPDDQALVCLDTKYIAGQMMLVRSLLLGMNVIAVEPKANPFRTVNHHIDFVALVPYQVDTILEEGYSPKLDKLKCAIIGGATISESLKKKIKGIKSHLYATYGMTETISHVALQKLNGPDAEDSFAVLGNTKINQDKRGCLIIHTDYIDEPIITNDLVNLIDSTRFSWVGRFDNIINSGGVKISPESVEKILEVIFEDENIKKRFFVAGIPDEKLGQSVVLFIEGRPLSEEQQIKILSKLATHIAKFELPREIKFIAEFSETKSGKVNRLETSKLAQV